MMTHKAFWDDPYRTELTTTVTAVDGNRVSVASSIFFANSGGQESDHGTLGGYAVTAAQKTGKDLLYTLADNHQLQEGDVVEMKIDWARRYRLMRLHFAAELILELFYQAYPGVEKIGAHIAEDKARIDFLWPENIAPLLPDLAGKANAIIAADLPIICAFDDLKDERRYWEIAGFSRVPCGGTHVRRTGEIGEIRLRRNNIGRGKERVEIFLI